MKYALFAALLLPLLTGTALGQAGGVCLFSDAGATQCNFSDNSPGIMAFYVVHTDVAGATAVQFAAPQPPCMVGATWLGDDPVFPSTIGNSQDGVAVAFGSCLPAPIHVLTMNYFGNGTTTADCAYPVTPDPNLLQVQSVDCSSQAHAATGGVVYINSSNSCDCTPLANPPFLNVSPSYLSFGQTETSLDLNVGNIGGGSLVWHAQSDQDWMTLQPISGGSAGTMTVTVDRTGLAPGPYTGTVTVAANGGIQEIPVGLSVASTGPILRVSPTTQNLGNGSVGSFTITNVGIGTLEWSLSTSTPWITPSPTSGTWYGNVYLYIDRTGLASGTYEGDVFVTSNGGDDTVHVTISVTPPVLSVQPVSLNFGTQSTTQTVNITNNGGGGTLTWAIDDAVGWVTATPSSASGARSVQISVNRSGLAVGTYEATLPVTSNGGNGTIQVEMAVVPPPELSVTPEFLDFGTDLTMASIQIANDGGGTLTWTISKGAAWLSTAPSSGNGNRVVTVSVNREGLPPGVYANSLLVSSNDGTGSVAVTMAVPEPTEPVLAVSPLTLDFGATETSDVLAITNVGVGTLTWNISSTAAWLDVAPASGTGDADVTLTVDRTGLGDGTYSDSLHVTSNGGNAAVVVTMAVTPPEVPVLSVTPTVLDFGPATTFATLQITNAGTGTLTWAVTKSESWMMLSPEAGTGNGAVGVTVNRNGLSEGSYGDSIAVSSNGGNAIVPVSMQVGGPMLFVAPDPLQLTNEDPTNTLRIQNTGSGVIHWSLTTDTPWLLFDSPTTGQTTGNSPSYVGVRAGVGSVPPGGLQFGSIDVSTDAGDRSVIVTFRRATQGYGGLLSLSADTQGSNCFISDVGPGLLTAHVVHTFSPGTTGSSFSAPRPPCMTDAVWIADSSPLSIVTGNSQTGVSVVYGACLTGAFHVLSITYFGSGTTPACCWYPILPNPSTGFIDAVDCNGLLVTSFAGSPAVINGNYTCDCSPALAAEQSTWGRVKALYSGAATPSSRR